MKGIIGNLLLFEICISWQSNWFQAFTNLFSIRFDYVSICTILTLTCYLLTVFGLGEGYVGSCLDTGIDPKVLSTSKEENIPYV